MVPFPQVSPPEPCAHLSPPPYAPHFPKLLTNVNAVQENTSFVLLRPFASATRENLAVVRIPLKTDFKNHTVFSWILSVCYGVQTL